MKRLLAFSFLCCVMVLSSKAQGKLYPVSNDGDNTIVTGFSSFSPKDDKQIFANAFLWAVEQSCTMGKDGIKEVDIDNLNFKFYISATSDETSKIQNNYNMEVSVKIMSGRLVFYISDITIESIKGVQGLIKKSISINTLKPSTKPKDKEVIDDFVKSESKMLNMFFNFIDTNKHLPITHWKEISQEKAVKGMNEDEVRIAFGKSQAITESSQEIQWMYSSSFYIFFKNGKVEMVMQ